MSKQAANDLLAKSQRLYKVALAISDQKHNGAEPDDEDWTELYYATLEVREACYAMTDKP